MKKLIKLFFNILPKIQFFISARNYLSYYANHGYFPSKKNMRYLNDYMFFLKNSPASSKYGYFIDKDTVKRFIEAFLGNKYVTPTLGVFDDIEKLKVFSYSGKYVVKPTHMAGRIIIKDGGSLNQEELKLAEKWLKENYGKISRECCYMNLNPKILIENFVSYKGKVPYDYKFFVINGKCELIQVNLDRFGDSRLNLYDRDWNKLDLQFVYPNSDEIVEKPVALKEMLEISEKVGSLFPFVRVDLYIADEGIRFGELTFVPAAGLAHFKPKEFEAKLYEKLNPADLY
ncbi:MAG TPA: ATP-grasp fold amidoligase family protein [Candidatus Gastranaerophilales bacterium]|nr:ATP-grasp fold amidoligase family protein [Candidatus Gastranaerophilales bacterium]